jgi:hypothetical protein
MCSRSNKRNSVFSSFRPGRLHIFSLPYFNLLSDRVSCLTFSSHSSLQKKARPVAVSEILSSLAHDPLKDNYAAAFFNLVIPLIQEFPDASGGGLIFVAVNRILAFQIDIRYPVKRKKK